jgi:uncharacterized 2Fe-2S/4Fe-4S cluster protein (DUF4445 family)
VSAAGNAAGTGAVVALLDANARSLVESEVGKVEKVETAVADEFQQHFVRAMAIPHKTEPFEELSKVVALPARSSKPRNEEGRRRGRRRREVGVT